MGWLPFRHTAPTPVPDGDPDVDPDAEPLSGPAPGTPFTGASACFHEGFYYPIVNDDNGVEAGPNLDSRLVWKNDIGHPNGGYLVHAAPKDMNHFHQYGMDIVELDIGGQD